MSAWCHPGLCGFRKSRASGLSLGLEELCQHRRILQGCRGPTPPHPYPAPKDVALLGSRVFNEVVKLHEIMQVGPNLIRLEFFL